MKSAELEKTLEGFEKKELIRLIIELAKLKKYNMEWLEIEFQRPDGLLELLEYYKKKISRLIFRTPKRDCFSIFPICLLSQCS